MSDLTNAIIAYTSHGTGVRPRDDEGAVLALSQALGIELLPEVRAALADVESIDMSDLAVPSAQLGGELRARLRARRPDLEDLAVDALANWWAYGRVWDAIPSPAERPRVRYFAVFTRAANGQRVPRALYRREDDGTTVRDSVLRDVGQWQDDARKKIWDSYFNSLETDLEPITTAQAEEFQQMVAVRNYRPFTH